MENKKQEKFGNEFVFELGKFVGAQKGKAQQEGLTHAEFQAIITTTFELLGRNAERFRKRAGIE